MTQAKQIKAGDSLVERDGALLRIKHVQSGRSHVTLYFENEYMSSLKPLRIARDRFVQVVSQ